MHLDWITSVDVRRKRHPGSIETLCAPYVRFVTELSRFRKVLVRSRNRALDMRGDVSEAADQIEPIEVAVMEVEGENYFELCRRKEGLDLVEIVPLHPGGAPIGFASPLGK